MKVEKLKNCNVSNAGIAHKPFKGRDGSEEELDRETGEGLTTMGRTRKRMADDRLPK